MSLVIQVDEISKNFGDFKAVDNLSFTVNQGDVYGFLGQNGAGKSTTIRILLTLIAPSSGSVKVFGKDLASHRHEILRQVGAVIERPDLYKYLTAFENLRLFAKLSGRKVTDKIINDQLEMVGLLERAHSKVKTFSQGMKQRLGIAIALVHDPGLIILDEPTNGLDPQGIADIRNLILHLSKGMGKTVVVSSHLLSEIEMIATRMLIIDKGKKIAEGSVTELFDPSKVLVELKVKDFTAAHTYINNSPWKSRISEVRENEFFLFQMPTDSIPLLISDLNTNGVAILSIFPRHSLEDFFLSLTTSNQHVDTFKN